MNDQKEGAREKAWQETVAHVGTSTTREMMAHLKRYFEYGYDASAAESDARVAELRAAFREDPVSWLKHFTPEVQPEPFVDPELWATSIMFDGTVPKGERHARPVPGSFPVAPRTRAQYEAETGSEATK